MALTRITKGVIKPNENYDTHNINSTGIITATGGNITGNLSVGGVLTYEDVTSIDSVGIITAQQGIHVGAGVSVVGIVTAASFRGDGSQLTGIDATSLKDTGGNVKIQAQASGAVHTGIATFTGLVGFGTNITLQDNGEIRLGERESGGNRTGDLIIRHDPSLYGNPFNVLQSNHGNLQIENRDTAGPTRFLYLKSDVVQMRTYTGNEALISATINSDVKLFYDNSEKLATTSSGVSVTGNTNSSGNVVAQGNVTAQGNMNCNGGQLTFSNNSGGKIRFLDTNNNPDYSIESSQGLFQIYQTAGDPIIKINTDEHVDINYNLDLAAGLDVIGTTNLRNTNIARDLDVDGHTNLDNVSISGISSTGNIYITTGGDGRKLSFAGDGSSHYIKMDHTLNGPIVNGYGGISFETNGTNERLRIDNAGTLLVAHDTKRDNFNSAVSSEHAPIIQLEGNNQKRALSITATNNNDGGILMLARQNGNPGANTVVSSGDQIGRVDFQASGGTNMELAAQISAEVDGTPGDNDMPGRLLFKTTANGANNPTVRLSIDSTGITTITSQSNEEIFRIQTSSGNSGGTQGKALMGFDHFSVSEKPAILIGSEEEGVASYKGSFVIKLKDAAATDDDPVERLRIKSNGYIGINQTNPERQLHIVGNDGATGATLGNSDTCLILDNQGTNGAIMEFLSDTNGAGRIQFTDTAAANRGRIEYIHSDDTMRFRTNGTERVRIENAPGITVQNFTSGDGDNNAAVSLQEDYNAWGIIFRNDWVANANGWGTFWAGSAGARYRRVSSDTNPNEYTFVGSGNKRFTFELNNGAYYSDGSVNGNNYDYAEYFEWEDGNPSNEDRRGYSVFVNSNGKIEKATDSTNTSDIIGAITGTAFIIGDGAVYDWQGKWKVDEWGTVITEDVKQVTWKDEDGKSHSYDEDKIPSGLTVPSDASYRQHSRRILNPDYDETKVYVPRDKRQEWDTVGLLGKVRVRDDSPKNPNWKFIKTVNGKKLWLIR